MLSRAVFLRHPTARHPPSVRPGTKEAPIDSTTPSNESPRMSEPTTVPKPKSKPKPKRATAAPKAAPAAVKAGAATVRARPPQPRKRTPPPRASADPAARGSARGCRDPGHPRSARRRAATRRPHRRAGRAPVPRRHPRPALPEARLPPRRRRRALRRLGAEREAVAVIGDFNGWSTDSHPASVRCDGSGIWEVEVPGVAHGQRYKYRDPHPRRRRVLDKADPFARHAELPPATASIAWTPDGARSGTTPPGWRSARRAQRARRADVGLRGAPRLVAARRRRRDARLPRDRRRCWPST